MASKHWTRLQEQTNPNERRYARQSLDLVDRLHFVLREKRWTQKDLARKLGKADSEISKWLSPAHNMTLKTVAKLETALDVDLLLTPIRFAAKEQAKIFGADKESQHYKAMINGHHEKTAAVSISFSVPQLQIKAVIESTNNVVNASTGVLDNDDTAAPVENGTLESLITAA